MRKLSVPGLLPLVFCLSAVACGGNADHRARFLSIATGGTGGVYYPYGGGLAKVVEREPSRHPGDGGSDGGVGRQPQVHSRRQGRHRVHAGRHARRRGQRARRVCRRAGAGRERSRSSTPTTRTSWRRAARASRRSAICAAKSSRPDRPGSGTEVIALRILKAAGRRSATRHPAPGARRLRVGRRAEGRQDRRVLLERRAADRRHPGSVAHARASRSRSCRAAISSPRCSTSTARSISGSTIPARRLSRRRAGGASRRRRERARRESLDGRAAGLRHHPPAVRETGRARRDSP